MIRMSLPFKLNHINCFLAEDEEGWKIIDSGLNNKKTEKRWSEVLEGKKITDILVSHYHPDHFGYVGALQKKTGARVSMTKTDSYNGLNSWQKRFLHKQIHNYSMAGISTELANKMVNNTEEFIPMVTPYPEVNHYFKDGETIIIGKYQYEIIFTPGHSEGMVTFYNKEKSLLLSTDHILPNITPNISYWFSGDANPLDSFLQSLRRIKELEVDIVIPSHGDIFYGANDRIDNIILHHEERLSRLLEIINRGNSAYEASKKLFRKDLNIHETRHSVGETLAHLEYLRLKGECDRELRNGIYWYFV